MIFNITVLKRLMKTAYNGAGLLVANNQGNIIIGGRYWKVEIDEYYFPKKAKAALVELIGQLPQQGESFRCTSSGNQVELPGEDIFEVADNMNWKDTYEKVNILIDVPMGNIRPYQKKEETIYLNEIFDSLLDGTVEVGEDDRLQGPCKREAKEHRVFFATESCVLEAWEIVFNPDTERLSEYNKTMDQIELMLVHKKNAQSV